MSVGKRIKALKNDYVSVKKTHQTGTDEAYAQAVTTFLDRLRKTWERAVEECLFNKVVERFNPGVSTLRLSVIDIHPTDHVAVEDGMSTCSAWVHDPAQPLANPPPSALRVGRDGQRFGQVDPGPPRTTPKSHRSPEREPTPHPSSPTHVISTRHDVVQAIDRGRSSPASNPA